MTLRTAVAGTVLAAALVVGGSTAAVAAVPHAPVPGHVGDEDWCARLQVRVAERQAQLAHLEAQRADLVARRAAADAAGRTREVQRLDAAIARVDERLAHLTERIAALQQASSDYCEPEPTS